MAYPNDVVPAQIIGLISLGSFNMVIMTGPTTTISNVVIPNLTSIFGALSTTSKADGNGGYKGIIGGVTNSTWPVTQANITNFLTLSVDTTYLFFGY